MRGATEKCQGGREGADGQGCREGCCQLINKVIRERLPEKAACEGELGGRTLGLREPSAGI